VSDFIDYFNCNNRNKANWGDENPCFLRLYAYSKANTVLYDNLTLKMYQVNWS
jgi:hypothetical protein